VRKIHVKAKQTRTENRKGKEKTEREREREREKGRIPSAQDALLFLLLAEIEAEQILEGHEKNDFSHWKGDKAANPKQKNPRDHEERVENEKEDHFNKMLVDDFDAEQH